MIRWALLETEIKLLKDHSKNPRQITKDQIKHLEALIAKFGLIDKPIVNSDMTIIGGHQRIRILKKQKVKKVECWLPDRLLTQEEIDHLCIGLNLNQGAFDYDILANEWDPIDLLKYGFTEEQLLGLEEKINKGEVEEDEYDIKIDEENAKTKIGDIYELGNHRIICGSSTDKETVEKLSLQNKVDLIITDPPYNVAYVGKTKDALTIQNDSMSDSNFFQFLLDSYINMFKVCKEGSPIYVFHADTEGMNFRKAFKEAGFKLSECLIWMKNTMVMGRQDYHWRHEPVLYGWKEGQAHKWYSDRKQTTVMEFDRPSRSEEHPTMKPIKLIAYLIQNSSKQGDIVFDAFLGSGTTLIAAEQTGRVCYGIELSPSYCDVIVSRWCKLTGKKAKRNGVEIDEL